MIPMESPVRTRRRRRSPDHAPLLLCKRGSRRTVPDWPLGADSLSAAPCGLVRCDDVRGKRRKGGGAGGRGARARLAARPISRQRGNEEVLWRGLRLKGAASWRRPHCRRPIPVTPVSSHRSSNLSAHLTDSATLPPPLPASSVPRQQGVPLTPVLTLDSQGPQYSPNTASCHPSTAHTGPSDFIKYTRGSPPRLPVCSQGLQYWGSP